MVDQSKTKIEQKLKEIRGSAKEFESSRKGRENMGIVIVNVGHCYDPADSVFRNLNDEFELDDEQGEGCYERFYELTYEGEPLNLNEYAVQIADTRTEEQKLQAGFQGSCHVMVLDDKLWTR